MSSTLGTMMATACRRYGDRTAITGHGDARTYRQLLERGARFANAMAGLGLQPGDHVAALLEDRVTAFEVYIGCFLGGYPVVHVNDKFTSAEVGYVLDDSDAKALVHTDGRSDIVAGVPGIADVGPVVTLGPDRPDGAHDYEDLLAAASTDVPADTRQPEDLAILGYTSGTTGFPKGAMASHRAVTNCITLIPHAYRLPMYGRCAFTGTLSFVSGIWGVILPHLYTGGTVDFLFPYTPESWVDHIIAERCTFTYAPSPLIPLFVQEVRKRPEALDSLQAVLHSASPVPRPHAVELIDLIGDRFVEVWGMTESVAPVTGTTRQDYHGFTSPDDLYTTVGRALSTASIRVVDQDRQPVPPGEVGELVIEADTLFSGYYGNPEATAEALVDGEYYTGDLGRIDEHGYVYVTGRSKELIISGGMNVYPAEIETVLATMPGVAESAVFGVDHDRWGETPVVAAVRRPDADISEDDVTAFIGERLAKYKKPHRVVFVDALPRNASLKIQKHLLREAWDKGEL
jgi:acyl-CoA synthetase (AMP-forming)/AMP-acid ligase II